MTLFLCSLDFALYLKIISLINASIRYYVAVCLYKQLLNKEGWATDMFITSTFSVIRSRPLLSYFHASEIFVIIWDYKSV